MKQLKKYARSGLIIGLILGILLSILAILTVYACNFVFNPGGSYPPAGICETATSVYFPILILFMFAPLFGVAGAILPAILLTAIFSGIGALVGRFLQRRYGEEGLTTLSKSIIGGLLVIVFFTIVYSLGGIYMDRSEDLKKAADDYGRDLTARTGALFPRYFPEGLKKTPVGIQVEEGAIYHDYACEKDESGKYSVEIIDEPLRIENAHYSLNSPWRMNPEFMYTQEEVSIGENAGFYFYFKDNSDTELEDFEAYVKPNRGVYWNNGKRYFEIMNKKTSACIFSKEELVKMAESMR